METFRNNLSKNFASSDDQRPTVCVTGRWAGVDNAWEQDKLEARKMLENGDESQLSSARFVSLLLIFTEKQKP